MRPVLRKALLAAVMAALLVPGLSRGHGDGVDARGTIGHVSATEIVVTTSRGDTKRFAVTEQTEVLRGTAPAKLGDARPGERVVVHARKTPTGPEATSIRLQRAAPRAR